MIFMIMPISEMVRVVRPGSFSNSMLRKGAEIAGGTKEVIERSLLPNNDRARLEILEATQGIEIINIIVNEKNELKTIDVSLTSAITRALVSMDHKGLQRPFVYNDGYVIQLNF